MRSTCTYWEVDGAAELADLQPDPQADDGVGTAVKGGGVGWASPTDHRDERYGGVTAVTVSSMKRTRRRRSVHRCGLPTRGQNATFRGGVARCPRKSRH
jgi:hypothetical protein